MFNDNGYQESFIMHVIALLFRAITVVLLFASFGVAAYMLPQYWKDIRNSSSGLERAYFSMRFCVAWGIFYTSGSIILLSADALFNDSHIIHWWPTISFMLFLDPNMSHENSVYLDVVVSMVFTVVSFFCANMLGDDPGAQYSRPDWAQGDDHIKDVMQRYEQVKRTNPRNNPLFSSFSYTQRTQELALFDQRMKDIEERVRVAHSVWNRKSPI